MATTGQGKGVRGPLSVAVGGTIRRLRKEKGWSLRRLAREASVSVPFLSELERGKRSASLEFLGKLSKALQVELDDLIGETEQPVSEVASDACPPEFPPYITDSMLRNPRETWDNYCKGRSLRGVLSSYLRSNASHLYHDLFDEWQDTRMLTGFSELDKLTGGLQSSELVILAGMPSTGITSLGLLMARNMAVDSKVPVAIFALGTAMKQVAHLMLCAEAHLDRDVLWNKFLDEPGQQRVHQALFTLCNAPIHIDEADLSSVWQLQDRARFLKEELGIRLLVLDSLQLMSGNGHGKRLTDLLETVRDLKKLARELDITVVILVQMGRPSSLPLMATALLEALSQEIGSIDRYADLVMFLMSRGPDIRPQGERRYLADLLLAKNRDSDLGQVAMQYFPEQARFAGLGAGSSEQALPSAAAYPELAPT